MDGEEQEIRKQENKDMLAMLRSMVQAEVVRAVNQYAATREAGESGRFHALMAKEYPMLEQLGGGSQEALQSDSEDPAVAMIGEHGAHWGQYLPIGNKDGQCLVWNHTDKTWDVGEAAGKIEMAWAAEDEIKNNGHTIHHRGGTVTFLGGTGTTFPDGDHNAGSGNAYCYLYFDASGQNGDGSWSREIESTYPSNLDDGDVFIPLWKLENGVLTQETLGAIVIPAVKNVVDMDDQ